MNKKIFILIPFVLSACGGGSGTEASPKEVVFFQDEYLPNMNLYANGGLGTESSDVTITKSEDNKITNIQLEEGWYNSKIGLLNFQLNSDGSFSTKNYSYTMVTDTGKKIQFNTNNKNLSLQEIQEGMVSKVNSSDTLSDAEKQSLINAIYATQSKNDILTRSWTENRGVLYIPNIINDTEDCYKIILRPVEMTVDISAYGKALGLQFSNFGQLRGTQYLGTENITKEDVGYVFAGGNDINKIEKNTMSGEMAFSGKSVGQVVRHIEHTGGIQTNKYMFIDSDAVLVFNNGDETLTMNFSENSDVNKRWYDVEVIKNNGDMTVNLSNGDKIAQQNQIFKFANAEEGKSFVFETINNTTGDAVKLESNNYTGAGLRTDFFGKNPGSPVEVVGRASLKEQTWGDGAIDGIIDDELSFSATFGAKLDEN